MRSLTITLSLLVTLPLSAEVVEISDEWRELRVPAGSAGPPPASAPWKAEETRERGDLWLRNVIPPDAPAEGQLIFRGYASDLEIFIGNSKAYSFHQPNASRRLTLHSVPLPHGAAGRNIFVKVGAPTHAPYLGGMLVSDRETLPRAITDTANDPLSESLLDIILGFALAMIGLIAIAASLSRRRADETALVAFGLFCALYGIRLILETYLPLLLGMRTNTQAHLVATISYLITVPGWGLVVRLVGAGWRSTLRWQVAFFALFAIIAIPYELITDTPGSLDWINNILVITGGINILFNLVRVRAHTTEERLVIAGSVAFMLLALNNNLVALGVVPWEWEAETLGFVLFTAALGYAAVRKFIVTERQYIAIEGELETAREIQQSLLPRTMPALEGLTFAASFSPASSVAGDLYDFLQIDDHHVGAVVADVSGHGVPAALVASMVKVGVSSQARLASRPPEMLAALNDMLCREQHRSFVTASYLAFDTGAKEVEIANGGHPAPILWRRASDEVLELGTRSPLLGRFPTAKFTSAKIPLFGSDRIVVYTDGVTEARNERGEEFGEARLHAALRASGNESAAQFVARLAHEVESWRQTPRRDRSEFDDVTVVVVDVG